jgi:RNA polymerase sigma-70 factor (ECF subfamily)
LDHNIHEEKLLFRQIAAGDEAAFETLFYLYLPLIQPVIGNMVKSEAVVKDLVQEIWTMPGTR